LIQIEIKPKETKVEQKKRMMTWIATYCPTLYYKLKYKYQIGGKVALKFKAVKHHSICKNYCIIKNEISIIACI